MRRFLLVIFVILVFSLCIVAVSDLCLECEDSDFTPSFLEDYPQSDLRITISQASSSDDELSLGYTMTGSQLTSRIECYLAFYLSVDNEVSDDDQCLGWVRVEMAPTDELTKTYLTGFKSNGYLSSTDWYVLGTIDPCNEVPEYDETNNADAYFVFRAPVPVTGEPTPRFSQPGVVAPGPVPKLVKPIPTTLTPTTPVPTTPVPTTLVPTTLVPTTLVPTTPVPTTPVPTTPVPTTPVLTKLSSEQDIINAVNNFRATNDLPGLVENPCLSEALAGAIDCGPGSSDYTDTNDDMAIMNSIFENNGGYSLKSTVSAVGIAQGIGGVHWKSFANTAWGGVGTTKQQFANYLGSLLPTQSEGTLFKGTDLAQIGVATKYCPSTGNWYFDIRAIPDDVLFCPAIDGPSPEPGPVTRGCVDYVITSISVPDYIDPCKDDLPVTLTITNEGQTDIGTSNIGVEGWLGGTRYLQPAGESSFVPLRGGESVTLTVNFALPDDIGSATKSVSIQINSWNEEQSCRNYQVHAYHGNEESSQNFILLPCGMTEKEYKEKTSPPPVERKSGVSGGGGHHHH